MMPAIHFIAIGGSAMHNLALALHDMDIKVTGSDDEIFEPSYTRLKNAGLLPMQMGWYPDQNIHEGLNAVILGMHARADNPELARAKQLGIKIYSYPEYIYEHSKNKQRVVIAGSHGKTTVTAMIMHVLKYCNKKFDYLVGSKLDGFDTMVKLSNAPVIIIEGDEYLASAEAKVPKFLLYHAHLLVVTGISWDHINVFPTFDEYKKQFELLIHAIPKAGCLIYNNDDKVLNSICKPIKREDLLKIEYTEHKSRIKEGITYLSVGDERYEMKIFGEHNMYNVSAAKETCLKLGVSEQEYYKAIVSFKGAANRLELIAKAYDTLIYKDFAHAPSKLEATTKAVAKQYPKKKLIACLELHTYSSLNKAFLNQYRDTFDVPDQAIIYYNPHTIKHKNLPEITEDDIKKGFNKQRVTIFNDSKRLMSFLKGLDLSHSVLLFMTSGNFDGVDLAEFAKELLREN
ncbi:MAG: Mur ligase family protein [Cytophagales bacterium]|nr:Mur ligase family protein [Cytophagales bacterium]